MNEASRIAEMLVRAALERIGLPKPIVRRKPPRPEAGLDGVVVEPNKPKSGSGGAALSLEFDS